MVNQAHMISKHTESWRGVDGEAEIRRDGIPDVVGGVVGQNERARNFRRAE